MEETDEKVDPGNVDQAAFWRSAPGRNWVRFQDDLDRVFAPVGQRLLERARPVAGERVLDVGCGTGATGLLLAEAVGPEGHVLGLDVAGPMLERARERRDAAGVGWLRFRLADAQAHTFTDEPFDLLVSRFGVMFFADPVAAFRNLRGALRPGGRAHFVAWAEMAANPWFKAPREAAVARLGEPAPAPPRAPGPLAFAETAYVREILERAGFTGIEAAEEGIDLTYPGGVEDLAYLVAHIGPAARIVREFEGTEADVEAIRQAVAAAFAPYATGDGVRVPARLNLFAAVAPE